MWGFTYWQDWYEIRVYLITALTMLMGVITIFFGVRGGYEVPIILGSSGTALMIINFIYQRIKKSEIKNKINEYRQERMIQ
jgi:ABC-type spermidine/putrescine transport system permease subunit I